MKMLILSLILILCTVPVGATEWHSDNRTKRILLTVDNSDEMLTDYQLMKNITYDGDMQADFDDLLFFNESGEVVPHWIESKTDSSTADVWLKIPLISTTEGAKVLMYYGNTTVSNTSNGVDTFIQFHGATTSVYHDTPVKTVPLVYENSLKMTATGTQVYLGVSNIANLIAVDSTLYRVLFNHENTQYSRVANDGAGTSTSVIDDLDTAVYYRTKIIAESSSSVKFYIDESYIVTITTNVPNEQLGLTVDTHTGTFAQEWAFIRKYTATKPTWGTDGSEETYEPTLNGTFLYPNSTGSHGYYGKLTSEMLYETGINLSDLSTFNLLTSNNLESLSTDDIDYISLDKTAANDGYLYVNFSLSGVESVNFINIRTIHNRNVTNPVILGLFNISTQKWHAVSNSSIADTDVEMTYYIAGSEIIKYTTLINGNLNLSVSLNTNGDENEDVFIDLIEVYVDYENTTAQDITLGYVYNLTMSNQNNISTLQTDVDNMNNHVNNLYLFVLLCTVFSLVVFRKRRDL